MDKYNQLTVLEEVKQDKRLMYRVQCDCGNVSIKRKDWVLSGRTTSCKSCASKRTAAKYPPPINRKGCSGLSGTHYHAIKSGASRRNIPFTLSPEFLWNLYETQKGRCALTGIEIILVSKIKNNKKLESKYKDYLNNHQDEDDYEIQDKIVEEILDKEKE